VQAVNYYAGPDARSSVFNGTHWYRGPDLLFHGAAYGYHSADFAGKMIYMQYGSEVLASQLLSFNGTTASRVPAPVSFYDYSIRGSTLYGLGENDAIYRTSDLKTWTKLSVTAPSTARSITTYNGTIYVDTTNSEIYAAPLLAAPLSSSSATAPAGYSRSAAKPGERSIDTFPSSRPLLPADAVAQRFGGR
jgi:hypothetical protein